MAKITANGTMQLRLLLVLMSLSSMVVAVDITFYSTVLKCSGASNAKKSAPEGECIALGLDGAVEFAGLRDNMNSEVFTNQNCSGTPDAHGKGDGCLKGRYKAAMWYEPTSVTHLAHITGIVSEKSTSIVFTEDAHCGSWVLKVPDSRASRADELLSKLESLPDGKKVNWLKIKGAVFHPSTAESC